MLHWITDSRAGFVTPLVIAFVLALGVYVLPALIAWSIGSPYRVAITVLDILLAVDPMGEAFIISLTLTKPWGSASVPVMALIPIAQ